MFPSSQRPPKPNGLRADIHIKIATPQTGGLTYAGPLGNSSRLDHYLRVPPSPGATDSQEISPVSGTAHYTPPKRQMATRNGRQAGSREPPSI